MVLSGNSEMDCVPADDNCGVSMPATWSDPKSAEGVETRYARMGVALNKTGESICFAAAAIRIAGVSALLRLL